MCGLTRPVGGNPCGPFLCVICLPDYHLAMGATEMHNRYDHAFTLGFSLISDDPEGLDVTPSMLREAVLRRVADLVASDYGSGDEWIEAVGEPYDTGEVWTEDLDKATPEQMREGCPDLSE